MCLKGNPRRQVLGDVRMERSLDVWEVLDDYIQVREVLSQKDGIMTTGSSDLAKTAVS